MARVYKKEEFAERRAIAVEYAGRQGLHVKHDDGVAFLAESKSQRVACYEKGAPYISGRAIEYFYDFRGDNAVEVFSL